MGTRHHSSATIKPLGRPRVVEGCRLTVKLHVTGINPRAEHPWVVQVALASFDKKDLEIVVEIGQSSSDNASIVAESAVA